jgi:type IV secretion system protein VirB5
MAATHKSTTYKPLEIANPFREGQEKAYADLLQEALNDKRFWKKFVGAGSLLLFLLSLCFSFYVLSRQKTVPVLINVMPSGETQYLGEVRQSGTVQVPEAAIQYQTRRFITNLRSVSTDAQVLYNNIDECYAMITASYEPVMTRYLRGASPFPLVGKVRRTVEIESILKVTTSSYQLDWVESTLDTSGTKNSVRMRAIVTIKLLPARDETLKKNPLGIYVDNCEMTEV